MRPDAGDRPQNDEINGCRTLTLRPSSPKVVLFFQEQGYFGKDHQASGLSLPCSRELGAVHRWGSVA
jgi:hypothetical protein